MTSRTILITGATSGIGYHAAMYLAERGQRVIATGRRQEALDELYAGVEGVDVCLLDVTDADSIAKAAAFVDTLTEGEGLDALVNNAGYGALGPLEEMSLGELRHQFETNVFGLVAVTQAFVPAMRARGAGRIVNIGSIGGRVSMPMFGAYTATKYAVESMSDAMRMELSPFGIQVSLIEPGAIDTGFGDRAMEGVVSKRGPNSPYAYMLDRAEEIRRFSDRQSVGPGVVSRAIEKAITARRPRARYVAPSRYLLTIALVKGLPTGCTDSVLARATGLTRRNWLRSQGKGDSASEGATSKAA